MDHNAQLIKITNEVTNRVREILSERLYKIILYGSYARGDFDEESDIDIMVLTDIEDENELRAAEEAIWKIGWEIGYDNGKMVTVFLKDRTHFYKWIDAMAYYRNVEDEGKVLYGA